MYPFSMFWLSRSCVAYEKKLVHMYTNSLSRRAK
jgi:hypothetical protein